MSLRYESQNSEIISNLVVVENQISVRLQQRSVRDYQEKPAELREAEIERASLRGRDYGVMCGVLMLGTYFSLKVAGATPNMSSEAELAAIIAMARIPSKIGYFLPRLHRSIAEGYLNTAEETTPPQEYRYSLCQRIGLIPDVLKMWTPNLFHPRKLFNNLKHPVGEIFHTRHHQYPLDSEANLFLVEHELFGQKVTLDIVKPSKSPQSWLLKTMQLFDPTFYFGHADYFPQPFELVDRTFLPREDEFDLEEHLKIVLGKRQEVLDSLMNPPKSTEVLQPLLPTKPLPRKILQLI